MFVRNLINMDRAIVSFVETVGIPGMDLNTLYLLVDSFFSKLDSENCFLCISKVLFSSGLEAMD